MRTMSILFICVSIIFSSCNTNKGSVVMSETLKTHYFIAKTYYLTCTDDFAKLDTDEIKILEKLERDIGDKYNYLLHEFSMRGGKYLMFWGCAWDVKLRIGTIDASGKYEHCMTLMCEDKIDDEKIISLDKDDNTYILLFITTGAGRRGVGNWYIYDVNRKDTIFREAQFNDSFDNQVEYKMVITNQYVNGMKVIRILNAENNQLVFVNTWNLDEKSYDSRYPVVGEK